MLIGILLAAPSVSAQSLQEVLLRAKPAAALIVVDVGAEVTAQCGTDGRDVTVPAPPFRETGTGWFINPSGWIVTSARVVAMAHESARWVEPALRESGVRAACLGALLQRRGLTPGERPDVEDAIARELAARVAPRARVTLQRSVTVLVPNGMQLPARIAKYAVPSVDQETSGRDLALLQVDAGDMPTLLLGDAARTRLGDRVHLIGFPDVVLGHELLDASAQVEASVTSGAVSGFKEDVHGAPLIQVDASATPGDSGGPAVSDRGEVIGVLAFVSRAREDAPVQGFNFIAPASAVREFMKDTGVAIDEPGAFNRAWWAALAAFFAGDHEQARHRLMQADRVVRNLPDVRRITAENDERVKYPPPRRFPWRASGATLTVIGATGWALAWLERWKRNRFRLGPREVAELLTREDRAPVLLDVRDTATYRRSPVTLPRALHVPAESLAAGKAALPVDSDRPVVAYCT